MRPFPMARAHLCVPIVHVSTLPCRGCDSDAVRPYAALISAVLFDADDELNRSNGGVQAPADKSRYQVIGVPLLALSCAFMLFSDQCPLQVTGRCLTSTMEV